MNAIAASANCAWFAASIPAWQRFRRALRHPEESQRQILRGLVADNTASAFGKAHGFDEIRTLEQFQQRVPIVDYDELAPWIARIVRGEEFVLTREPVTRLLPTGGSSGGRKLIPFTAALQRQFNAAISPWMVDLCRQHPSVLLGPAYWSISPAIPARSDEKSAVPIGFEDDSAYLGGIRRRLVEATFAVPSELRLVTDVEVCRYLTLLCLLRQPELRFVSVWHPSLFTLLLDALPVWWDELVDDVENGGCRRAASLPDKVRQAVHAPPLPRRARDLRCAGFENPHAIWPHLRVVSCWGDAHAALAQADLQSRLPRVVIQPKGLLATEAFVSIPYRELRPVAVTSHFFEFADPRGNVRLVNELRPGESYTVIVTAGGLWRYRLGDLVEVDGFISATPSLRFIGRDGGVSDVCGEKLTEAFVTRGLEAVCAAFGFAPRFAMLAPESDAAGRWGYTLFVEGETPNDLAACLDKELGNNPHYALCRDLGQLGPVGCFRVIGGAYELFCKAGVHKGRRLGDIKPQSLSPRTDWRNYFGGGSQSPVRSGE